MRVVYIAPIEALAKERYRDWEKKFGGGLNLRVVELTGETTTDLKLLEKSLFIIDELHLIGSQEGAVLEVIVSRMKYIASQIRNKIRFVALSTSLANVKDLGDWIGATSNGLFNFPPSVRPVPLEIYIKGVDIANFEARMMAMTKPTYTAIAQHAKNGKPALVFVPTKKFVRLTAMDLMTYSSAESGEKSFLLRPTKELEPFINKINDEKLKVTLREGVGYLHEGLNNLDHDIVTELFKAGWIQYYDGRENVQSDYLVTDHQQMMGHASRPLVERYRDWEKKFGGGLNLRVVELTGETTTDLKLLEKSLFIIDELHLIGSQEGAVLEVIVSRMKYIASQIRNKIRFVALSTSLANVKDLGDWIGATSNGLFNFPPSVRPVPLEIYIKGVDIANFEARMMAMTKPTYTAIAQHAKNGKPALVFVPTKKFVRLTAMDLMTYSSAESGEKSFLLRPTKELEPFINKINDEKLKVTLREGVGYLHEGLNNLDHDIVTELFKAGWIQYYDGRENVQSDYLVTDHQQMMGHASRPLVDNSGKCVILCHAPRKEHYKKFLYEAFPVESHLHHFLHDNLNAEIVSGIIENKQDAVDYLTWTFMYRRLTQNPNYYNLQGVSHRHLSDYLSEIVENTLSDLEASKCVAIEDDIHLSPLNLGMISSYYYTTIERFSSSITSNTKLKGLLEVLSSAFEYDYLPIRPREEEVVCRLINHQRFSFENPNVKDPHVKANALLQAHFSRQVVGGNLALDQREVLLSANNMLQAMVDVISSNGWLSLALLAMEVSQMLTQGLWGCDSMLLQLPHFTKDLARKCEENPGKSIETVFDLLEMEDVERRELLSMPDSQLLDIARFCNRFPNIDLSYEVLHNDTIRTGEDVTICVTLERDIDGKTEVGPVDAPRYPKAKEEGWWIVVGDTKTNLLLAIKRVSLQRKLKAKLQFVAPADAGKKSYMLYLMCDSYMGCDQEYGFAVDVKEVDGVNNDSGRE
ncbi:unnamed protein product [Trifolium pratense]|uniref:Uncharacterized protein n=1 Tax=Trifolium pratense TaxID=57577 RepID=A0ACB0KG91_TRIPR|nr:unnamed protein product [Trifolium pratense]